MVVSRFTTEKRRARRFWLWPLIWFGFLAFMLLIIALILVSEVDAQESTPTPTATVSPTSTPTFQPTPISRTAEYVGDKTARFHGAPVNHYQSNGGLTRNQNYEFGWYPVGDSYVYSIYSRNNKIILISNATQDFYQWSSDLDWADSSCYATWSINSISFNGEEIEPDILSDYMISGEVFDASRIAAFLNPSINRLLTKNNPGAESCTVTYTLYLGGGMYVDSLVGANGEYCIRASNGDLRFRIYRPKLLDENYTLIRTDGGEIYQGTHILTDSGGGYYEYTKNVSIVSASAEWIDADIYYSSSYDGFIYQYDNSWNTVINAADGNTTSYNGNDLYVISRYESTTYHYMIYRGFLPFTTSALAGCTIDSASLYIMTETDYSTGGTYILGGFQGVTLENADYDAFGYLLGFLDPAASGVWYSCTLNPDGINLTGVTYLCLRDSYDMSNIAIPASDAFYGALYYSSESANDPYLSVVYRTPTSTPTPTATPTVTQTFTPIKIIIPFVTEG